MLAHPRDKAAYVQTCLLITTYNWPEALELTLASTACQTLMPDEVIVADDGSGPATRAVVERWQQRLPVKHIWQDDQGFRVSRSRNNAIAAARADYIICMDGDMILHPRFVEDHVASARPDLFIQGVRPRLSPETTSTLLREVRIDVSLFSPGMERRAYAIRNRLLSRLASRVESRLGGIQGCNQSYWRRHAVEINGYDERFNGWGPEDREFAARLLHIGLHRLQLRHLAIAYHLYHPTRAPATPNPLDQLLAETLAKRAVWAECGLDKHRNAA